jgi:hypothetical protein
MTAHTEFRKGSTLFVHLKNGEKFVDKYEERKGRFVYLRRRGRVIASEIRAMSFNKP